MNKLVYLFELDSVRNSDKQMELAMKALFQEILINGNSVAITFNQLVDSRFFLSLLNDDSWANYITKLFQLGSIRISQFSPYRTPSQYLIGQALDNNEEYIFSGLPLKSSQKSLIALVKRSLMYSDLTELNEYIDGPRTDDERQSLFREFEIIDIDDGVGGKKKKEVIIEPLVKDRNEQTNTLHDLRAVLKLILQLSDIQYAYNPPKDRSSYKDYNLQFYLSRVMGFKNPYIPGWKKNIIDILNKILKVNLAIPRIPDWDAAIKILRECNASVVIDVQDEIKKTKILNKRSELLKWILDEYKKEQDKDGKRGAYVLAQAIIDLCYNFTCEVSVYNVSKHYDINDLKTNSSQSESFIEDFLSRLKSYYCDEKYWDKRFPKGPSSEEKMHDYKPYNFDKISSFFRVYNLKRAVNLLEHSFFSPRIVFGTQLLPYEFKLCCERCKQFGKVLGSVLGRILITAGYIVCVYWIEIGIDWVLTTFYDKFNFFIILNGLFRRILGYSLAVLILEVVSRCANEFVKYHNFKSKGLTEDYTRSDGRKLYYFKFPTFAKSLENLLGQLFDFSSGLLAFSLALLAGRVSYSNRKNVLKPSASEKKVQINHVSKSVADYISTYKDCYGQTQMFKSSQIMPIVDFSDNKAGVRLTKIEELTGKQYGIAYNSDYHKMVVDPMKSDCQISLPKTGPDMEINQDTYIYPYERLAPASDKSGVVTVPIIKDKDGNTLFVLIKQYRHAIRREQFNFPRGFGEEDVTTKLVLEDKDIADLNGRSGEAKEEMVDFYNAQKELHEEIGAILLDPDETKTTEVRQIRCVTVSEKKKFPNLGYTDNPQPALTTLGKITPDSGSLCDTIRVIQANLHSYTVQKGHEGIIDCIEITEDELDGWIKNGYFEDKNGTKIEVEIDDGFTIAAFQLWKLKSQNSQGKNLNQGGNSNP